MLPRKSSKPKRNARIPLDLTLIRPTNSSDGEQASQATLILDSTPPPPTPPTPPPTVRSSGASSTSAEVPIEELSDEGEEAQPSHASQPKPKRQRVTKPAVTLTEKEE